MGFCCLLCQVSDQWPFSYEAPLVTSMTPTLPTVGGDVVIHGWNLFGGDNGFGSGVSGFDVITVGIVKGADVVPCDIVPVNGANVTVLVGMGGLEELRCRLGAGMGTNWRLQLTVAGLSYTGVTWFSYLPPVLDALSVYHGM